MNINKIVLISVSLLLLIVGITCLNAASLNNTTADGQASDESHFLQGTLAGGPQGGLGSSKPASALGSTLGGGDIGGLGSSKPASALGSTLGGGDIGGLGTPFPNIDLNNSSWRPIIVDPNIPWDINPQPNPQF